MKIIGVHHSNQETSQTLSKHDQNRRFPISQRTLSLMRENENLALIEIFKNVREFGVFLVVLRPFSPSFYIQ
jgi:hypothetical protein